LVGSGLTTKENTVEYKLKVLNRTGNQRTSKLESIAETPELDSNNLSTVAQPTESRVSFPQEETEVSRASMASNQTVKANPV